MNRPTILLNPGPVTLTERVKKAFYKEDQCHREPEFAEIILDIKRRLLKVYPEAQENYESVVLSGSGTCAVEAMVGTLIPRNGKALVISNGVYGERMANMIRLHGKACVEIKSPWPEPMNLAEVERILSSDKDITHVLAVHNETTTGRLNAIDALGKILKKHDLPLIFDTVSSFAGEEIKFDDWNILALASTANKCIHAAPGLCFVIARRDVLEDLQEKGENGSPAIYLDLISYYKNQKSGFSPFTQAVHAAFSLQEGLKELEDSGGWKPRMERYRYLSGAIRRELKKLGYRMFLKEEEYCSMLSSFSLPDGYSYEELHDILKEAGFVIYAGQGGLFHSIFRVANMGDITDGDLERLLDVFRTLLVKEQA
ncbi:aminotransferase class V-fold PLP-dependent enzyme [Marispirochaeta sp.]|uniref:pyridoxal-phosphate-dependent aminotransferase family protein n=1 Tax=Marispirochaeta sp. TaxID=2038653 RepID=UPI0029C90B67|nr:aminotransferase class V-fold PLP-dependent enzyme [Marispirochaeta sp.]